MKQKATLVFIFLSIVTFSQTLLFKSSFEDGVYLDEPFYDDITSGTWWQHLQGSDEPGFSWPINLWSGQGVFQVLIDADLPHADYIQNTLETIDDENGNPTRVIHQKILQKAAGYTQDPYIIYTETELGDIYVSYKIKFTEDLKTLLGPDGWLTFFEWKTSGDYRIAAYIYENLNEDLYWYVHGDNEANGGLPYEEFWYREDHVVPVPEGQWFTTEFFWHRSTGADGRFWWSINGNIVADYIGPNKNIELIDRIMLFTAYTNSDSIDQWVDDVEIWDTFPCGEGVSCYQPLGLDNNNLDDFDVNFTVNPNPSTKNLNLKYKLPEEMLVKINLYNVQGELVKKILHKQEQTGSKELNTNLNDIANGIYFCKISLTGKQHKEKTLKIILKD